MYLIAELHNQYEGDISTAEQMILQSKMAGAHAVKLQLYDSQTLYGTAERAYLSLTFDETKRLKEYADLLRIDIFASFFDRERLQWCLELDFKILKIASITVERYPELCELAVATGRRVIMSLGKWDWKGQGMPFRAPNVEYLYCVAKYPALLEDVQMPDFRGSDFVGYSDHTVGISACLLAISRGAKVIEKHFTLSPSLQKSTAQAHLGSMRMDDLVAIRSFADDIEVMDRTATAFRKQASAVR
ncbi:MAG: N-acetylneuraminate synthase family protein [Chloroflexi bacterium]|nr:N-acetylneuraminate synthase family protein [Chloroflexota bacterium]